MTRVQFETMAFYLKNFMTDGISKIDGYLNLMREQEIYGEENVDSYKEVLTSDMLNVIGSMAYCIHTGYHDDIRIEQEEEHEESEEERQERLAQILSEIPFSDKATKKKIDAE